MDDGLKSPGDTNSKLPASEKEGRNARPLGADSHFGREPADGFPTSDRTKSTGRLHEGEERSIPEEAETAPRRAFTTKQEVHKVDERSRSGGRNST